MKIEMGSCRFIVTAVALFLWLGNPIARAHHVPLPDGMTEAEASWLWGYYTIPETITRDGSPYWYGYAHTDANKINDPAWTEVASGHIKADAKAPAVLVMHGCAGVIRSPTSYRVFFMDRGYAVFEPDSFARPGRKPCNRDAFEKRMEELAYAFEMIRSLPWVDQTHIVLMGISEGGAAASAWERPGFAAHIILADNCLGGRPQAPADIPVLAVVGEKDGPSCKVSRKIKGSRSIVIPNAPHDIVDYEETTQAMGELLDSL